jgi:hypothetical protein
VDDEGKAEAFNHFFADASSIDDTNHNTPNDIDMADIELLDSINVTVEEVRDQLSAIDIGKAYGPDGLPPRLLKEARQIICRPFVTLWLVTSISSYCNFFIINTPELLHITLYHITLLHLTH